MMFSGRVLAWPAVFRPAYGLALGCCLKTWTVVFPLFPNWWFTVAKLYRM